VKRIIFSVNAGKCPEQEIHSMPGLEAANKSDNEPTVEVQPTSKQKIIPCGAKKAHINGVRKDSDLFGRDSGFHEVTAECPRNRYQQARGEFTSSTRGIEPFRAKRIPAIPQRL